MQNWVRIPILISPNRVIEGLSNDNLTKVIMEMLTIGGRLLRNQIAQKLICFGQMVLMSFKLQKMVLQNRFMTPIPLILLYGPSHLNGASMLPLSSIRKHRNPNKKTKKSKCKSFCSPQGSASSLLLLLAYGLNDNDDNNGLQSSLLMPTAVNQPTPTSAA